MKHKVKHLHFVGIGGQVLRATLATMASWRRHEA